MVIRSVRMVVVFAMLVGCNAQSNGGGGGGLLPPEDSGSGGATCSSVCARQAAANCPGFSMGDCVSECTRFTSVPACASQSNAVLQCGMTANFTCGDGGADSTDCRTQAEAFALCVLSGGGDGGVDVTVTRD